jgi:peroxiredoxin
MTAGRQWIIVAVIVAVIGGAIAAAMHYSRDEFVQITVGSRAPDFRVSTVDSVPQIRTLEHYRGKVTLLNIWATWCIPCEREMPELQKLYEEYAPKGLHVAAVSIDSPGMEQPIRDFATQYHLTLDVLYDPDGRIKLEYGTTAVPETFVIGKDGVIRYHHFAAINDATAREIRALLDQLLAES